jgi:hypothetical protein
MDRTSLVALLPNVWVLNGSFVSDRERHAERNSFIPKPINLEKAGRRASTMQNANIENQEQRLRYLLTYYNENYLLERSLLSFPQRSESATSRSTSTNGTNSPRSRSTASIRRRNEEFPYEDAFHRKELKKLNETETLKQFLRGTILFDIGRDAQYECLGIVLQELAKKKSFEQLVFNIIHLPKYARQALLLDLYEEVYVDNDMMGELSARIKVAEEFVEILRRTSCLTNEKIKEHDLASFLPFATEHVECLKIPIETPTTPIRPTTPIVTVTAEQQAVIQEQFQQEFSPSTFRRKAHTPKENPMFKLSDSEDSTLLYSRTARVPKIGEPVIHLLPGKKILRGRVTELFPSGVVTVDYQTGFKNLQVNRMTWNAKGCWIVDDDTQTKPQLSTLSNSLNKKKKSTDVSMFTSNESWTSEFLMSSDEIITGVNKAQKSPGMFGPKWSKLNDNIPFRIFQIDEEFIIQPPKPQPVAPSHQLQFTNKSNTFITTVPDVEPDHDDTLRQLAKEENSITATQGGMNVYVPNILIQEKKQVAKPPPKIRPHHKDWTVMPGKSRFVVHNPLENHPYIQPIPKRESTARVVHEPSYTRGFMDISVEKKPLHEFSLPKLVPHKSSDQNKQ